MDHLVNERKLQHIKVIENEPDTDRCKYYFDLIRLTHRALPEIDFASVDPSISFLGKKLSFPLLISSMTGGDHEVIRVVNRNLALAAEAAGIAMGVGSQRVMFTTPGARESFELRKHAPGALLLANVGAVQLNHGLTTEMCEECIRTVGADGLFLHLNPLQEAAQPEGNTDFSGLARKIGLVAGSVSRPVIVKEVGAGISRSDADLLVKEGIRIIDVAGAGGTSWSRIEYHRDADNSACSVGRLYQDWGIPTPEALMELSPLRPKVTLIASGGVRTGLDMLKAVVLGASLCGIARPFLKPAMESADAVLKVIEALRRQFVTGMFLLGATRVEALMGRTEYIRGREVM